MKLVRKIMKWISWSTLPMPFCALAAVGCSADSPQASLALGSTKQSLTGIPTILRVPEDVVRRNVAPIRPSQADLDIPDRVYMKSVEETFEQPGTYSHVFHVYQANTNGESLQLEVSGLSGPSIDNTNTFTSVKLTAPDGTVLPMPNGAGQYYYTTSTSTRGWYRFELSHRALRANQTLRFSAWGSGRQLPIAWSDPPNADMRVAATLVVKQSASDAFLKGGAFRTANQAEFARVESVVLDNHLLYATGFDQGLFNFPLGRLTVGDHRLSFSLTASGFGPPKFWFGVNEKSFDPTGVNTSWAQVQFLYHGEMHTADYDAWSEGVAYAQGETVVSGVRPPPVRRGTRFSVAIESSALASQDARLRIEPYVEPTVPAPAPPEETWSRELRHDYTGGIFQSTGFVSQSREHWQVIVPSDAPIGRYRLRVETQAGAPIGQAVVFYVIHNPYVSVGPLSKAELETYGYDEDEDGLEIGGEYGSDQDSARDHFLAIYGNEAVRASLTASTRRTGASAFSFLDHAVAAAQGTTTELDTMRRLYRLVAQRLYYTRPQNDGDVSNILLGNSLTPADSLQYAQPGTMLSNNVGGHCYDYGASLTAIARSVGIVARAVGSGGLGGWGDHLFTEAYIPNVPQHGGKVDDSGSSPDSDTDPWYAFDSTDPTANGNLWFRQSEAIATRAQYGMAEFVLMGEKANYARTTPVDWEPAAPPPEGMSVLDAYMPTRYFWLTEGSISGVLGRGEKDVYRIRKKTPGPTTISVSAVPGDGDTLTLALCQGPFVDPEGPPVVPGTPEGQPKWEKSMETRCENRTATQPIREGDSFVVVFNDGPEIVSDRMKHGDTVKYVLNLE